MAPASIHLLTTFIRAASLTEEQMLWQTLIHLTFLVSALAIAGVERILPPVARDSRPSH